MNIKNKDSNTYSTIFHQALKELDVSLNEYAVADMIDKLSGRHIEYEWCRMGKDSIGKKLCLSRRTVITILKRLELKDLVEINKEDRSLKSTLKWKSCIEKHKRERCEVSSQAVKTPARRCENNIPKERQRFTGGCAKALHNIDNDKKNNEMNSIAPLQALTNSVIKTMQNQNENKEENRRLQLEKGKIALQLFGKKEGKVNEENSI